MVDFNMITSRLATGGALSSPDDVETLVSAGITHVIDCTDSETDANYDDTGLFAGHPAIVCLSNPTPDDGQHKDASWFAQSVWFAISALAVAYTKVYAHCSAGVNRGPSTCFAVMLGLGWDYNTAIDLIHQKRPITQSGIRYATDAANGLTELGYI